MNEQQLVTMKSTINVGDVIFTILSLGFPVLIVVVVIWLLASNKKRKNKFSAIDKN